MAKGKQFNIDGKTIKIKKALSKISMARNWALKAAQKKIAALPVVGGEAVTIDWMARSITFKDGLVFSQSRDELKGTFHGIAGLLTLE